MKELLHDDDVRMDARAEGREEGLAQGITGFIRDKLEDGADDETILRKLQKVYSLSEKEAEKHLAAVKG